jgi:malonyl-CoA O-methyltransferase
MPEIGTIAAAFHQQAGEYDHHVLVQKRVVEHLADSVVLHRQRSPGHILDIGTGTGALLERLHTCYPDARLTGVDIAHNMCLRTRHKLGAACSVVVGDAEKLPFKSGICDLAVSASVLQWVCNLPAALHELRRIVKPGGGIAVAFFCAGTLHELQDCFREAVNRRTPDNSSSTSRLHTFRTMDEVTELVSSLDFARAVVTVETEVDWYDNLHSLLRSIKNIGAGSVSGGAGNGLGWRGVLEEASRLYREKYGRDGTIPATYKVLYLTATVGE